jgi:nickel transport protein
MQDERVAKNRFVCGRLTSGVAVILGLILAITSVALAHKVYLYAWVEGDTVYTESYFGSNRKVQGGLIEIFDLSGKKLLEGLTNEKGEFAFKAPQKTDLRIVVEASMGHKNEYVLKADELWGNEGGTAEQTKAQGGLAPSKEEAEGASLTAEAVELAQIQAIVEKALDSRLKPIIRELAKIRKEKGPGLTEIIGGIGYIFGLMGVVLYFWSRKSR